MTSNMIHLLFRLIQQILSKFHQKIHHFFCVSATIWKLIQVHIWNLEPPTLSNNNVELRATSSYKIAPIKSSVKPPTFLSPFSSEIVVDTVSHRESKINIVSSRFEYFVVSFLLNFYHSSAEYCSMNKNYSKKNLQFHAERFRVISCLIPIDM